METPPEEQLNSLKTSGSEETDTSTPSPSIISPKKPIQLGIVQSSTGARSSPGNVTLMKKSRWDQAPGSGENEEDSKETTIQSTNPEESNIKSLIKKFEDISEKSKSESNKTDEESSSKPGRVKLVRTNFTKQENSMTKPIDSENSDIKTSNIEKADLKNIDNSSEIPLTEVVSVSSSKALQIISSNYDSPSDESSQEAENIATNAIQQNLPSDSGYTSLEKLSDSNGHVEKEDTIEDRSLSLKNESAPKSQDSVIYKNPDALTSKTEELNQDNFVEGNAEKTITTNIVECEMDAKDSHTKGGGIEISRGSLGVSIDDENNVTMTDQHEEQKSEEKNSDIPSGDIQHIAETSSLFNENIPSGKSKTQEDSINVTKDQDHGSVKFSNDNFVREEANNVTSNIPEMSIQAQLETIEIAGDCNSNSENIRNNVSQNSTEINKPLEKYTDDKNGKTNSILISEKVCNKDVENQSIEALVGEKNSTDEEEVKDFDIVTHDDVKDYELINESGSENKCGVVEETFHHQTSETKTLGTDNNLMDESSVVAKEESKDILKVDENSETVQEQIECLDNKPSDDTKSEEQTSSELLQTLRCEVDEKVLVFENEASGEMISKKETVYEKPQGNDNISPIFSDGVDAKMEQIFSEKMGNVGKEVCPSKENIEESLVSSTHEVVEESIVSQDSISSDKSSKPEESDNILETNDSLLKLLESEGSPEANLKETNVSEIEMDVSQSKMDDINVSSIEENVSTQQSSTVSIKHNSIQDKYEALTKQVEFDSKDIEDAVLRKMYSEEKSVSKDEIKTKHVEDTAKSEKTNDLVDSKNSLEIKIQGLDIVSDTISNADYSETQLTSSKGKTWESIDSPCLESKSSTEKVQCVEVSNLEIKASVVAHIEEDRQPPLKGFLKDFTVAEESEIVIKEVEDIQSSAINSGSEPMEVMETEVQEYTVTRKFEDSTDEAPDISKDIVIEEKDCVDSTKDLEITKLENSSKTQSPKIEEAIINETDTINNSDNLSKIKHESTVVSFESSKIEDISNLPDSSIQTDRVQNEIISTNLVGDAAVADKREVISQKKSVTQSCDLETDSTIAISESKNVTQLDSSNFKNLVPDSPCGSNPEEPLNESKELSHMGDASVSDSLPHSVDSKRPPKQIEGSIEVSQQETIERSIDMLFEVPSSEQPQKSSPVSSTSSSKDMFEVSTETKKLFSEEIQKEMLKLSPEHEAQCEVEVINITDPRRLSLETEKSSPMKLEDNVIKKSDSCELSNKSRIGKDGETTKLSVELEKEEDILMSSEDSDIATIQAIDSFLEGDNVEISKDVSESNSKSEHSSITIADDKSTQISTNKEDSNDFVGSSSISERTNAEDVMLGVEGELDLDNSLTYGTKKLDLSPSSEPSISEENYDLPGDSYDKETLEKEQENTNLLSDVLNDVETNTKENDSELLMPITKKSEKKEHTVLETTSVSEIGFKVQVCRIEKSDKITGRENNKEQAKDNTIVSKIKIQPIGNTSEINKEIDKLKMDKNSSVTEETNNEESLLKSDSGIKTELISTENGSKELPTYTSNILNKTKEQTVLKSTINIASECEFPSIESIETTKKKLDKESKTEVSQITTNEPQTNNENVTKTIHKAENKDETEESLTEQNQTLSEESNYPRTESSSSITLEKKDLNTSSTDSLSVDISDSNKKTNKQLCSLTKEMDRSNIDEDNTNLDVNKEPKGFKKTSTFKEIELDPPKEHTTPKPGSGRTEIPTSLTVPCQSPNESQTPEESTDKLNPDNKQNEEVKHVSHSSNQPGTATTDVKSKSIDDTPNQSTLSTEENSITPKDLLGNTPSKSQPSNETTTSTEELKTIHDDSSSNKADFAQSESSKEVTSSNLNVDEKSISDLGAESKSASSDSTNQVPLEAVTPVLEQGAKSLKSAAAKEIPAPVRVSARQKQRQAAALAAKEKAEAVKSVGQGAIKKISIQEKQGDKRGKKSLSPMKELHVKICGKSTESGKQSPLGSQKSPKNIEPKVNLQISPKKMFKDVSQDKLEPITLKLSKEENPVIVRSSSLSPKKNLSPHSPQGKTLGYTLKIGKDSTTIIPKDSSPSPTRRESSPGTGNAKADLSGKVGYLIKDTGLTITPVAPPETQEQKLNKITLKLSKAGGHPEIKQESKSETWKAIRKLGEIDIVPVEGKSPTETSKRKDKSDEGSPEKKIKLGDLTVEPSTSSGVSKLQGLLTQAPLNQSDSSEDGKFIGFGSPTEKVSPTQQQQQTSYDIGMIRHDDSPQPPRKRGRPRKITSPDDIVHSVSVSHTLPSGLSAKDILAASLQHQSLQQHLHPSFQPRQSYHPPPEDLDSSQPMVPLFDLFEDTFIDPSPPTIFPDQVQPSTEVIMRSARGRPIGRSRRPRGSSLLRGHERGGPRGRPRGSRGIKRILEEMEVMSFPDPDQPITLDNIDAEMGPRMPEHAASELTMALLRKSIEGKKESLEKKARRSDGSEEGNSDLDAMVREMKEKIEAAYQAELKSPGKEGKKRTPEKLELTKKSPPGLIPIHQKQDERRKSAEGKESVKRKLSESINEEGHQQVFKRKSTDEKPEILKSEEGNLEESIKEESQMEVDQPATSSEEPSSKEESETKPEPPPKPVKPRPKSKAEIKRIKREKDRLRREAKKLAALEALKAPPPNPCEEDTRMSASDPNGDGIDGEGSGIKKNRMEVGDPEGKEFTVEHIAEYQWPLQGGELYMIQEQISTWLGVKSFQRKYPDLKRRRVEMEERTYLCDSGLVSESMCDLGLTAVSSSEVLDIMFQDFPDQYEELRKYMREKQARELINKQKEKKKFEQTLSKSDLKEHAIQSLASWNSNLNRSRNENRKCHLDLQTWTIQYPRSKAAKMTRPSGKLGSYPVALIPGQYADYYKRYTPQELRYFPVNTVLYGPLQPNEMHSTGGSDGSQSESEDSSSSDGSSDSSSEGEGEGTEEDEKERGRERECKTCGSKKTNEAMLQCSQCSHNNTTVTVWA